MWRALILMAWVSWFKLEDLRLPRRPDSMSIQMWTTDGTVKSFHRVKGISLWNFIMFKQTRIKGLNSHPVVHLQTASWTSRIFFFDRCFDLKSQLHVIYEWASEEKGGGDSGNGPETQLIHKQGFIDPGQCATIFEDHRTQGGHCFCIPVPL